MKKCHICGDDPVKRQFCSASHVDDIPVRKGAELFNYLIDNTRHMTDEERKVHQDGINKIFKRTGRNLFDLRYRDDNN